ncbi:MAG: hypothetical protein IPL53_23310 [Ignavibacteria bacterium]|nr:hypothetical protein [Ignavibacteria bacterium]
MKTIFSSFLLLFLSFNISFSQSGWIRQHSNTINNLNDIFFINSMTGWCVGDSITILKTTNGGIDWSVQLSSGQYKLSSIFFINENTGWCCGGITDPLNYGVIYKTTNSGVSWVSIYSGGGSSINNVYFINENTGFRTDDNSLPFGSAGSISKTTNGGLNWTSSLYNQYRFTGINFININTGWAAGYYWSDVLGDSSVVFKTTDGGNSWQIKYRERGGMIKDISFNNNKVWLAGKDSSVLFSSDNGDNWIKQNTNSSRRFNSVFFINENTGWAAGYRYPDTTNIIKSTNGGVSWFDLKNDFANTLNSTFFFLMKAWDGLQELNILVPKD